MGPMGPGAFVYTTGGGPAGCCIVAVGVGVSDYYYDSYEVEIGELVGLPGSHDKAPIPSLPSESWNDLP